jgi:hypothetical protein
VTIVPRQSAGRRRRATAQATARRRRVTGCSGALQLPQLLTAGCIRPRRP